MNKRRTAALAVLFSTLLAGTYAAMRVAGPSLLDGAPPTDSPTAPPTYSGCAYVWAYEDLPEITEAFDTAVRQLIPGASGRAQAFGENCVYADGRADFGAMETDLYVSLEVPDLNDEAALGDRMSAIMKMVLEKFPGDRLPGGQDGFVEFAFRAGASDSLVVRVSIQSFRAEGQGLTGRELFRKFHPQD